ncbi:MAG TPA: hypothetical protein VM818_04000 [Vicinamibacterales bacterium]|nr:hypothetical protein [Vicinamibacterales bacterium]
MTDRAVVPDYCRQIETYLCQKNDGHLIRVTGPSFDLVSAWAEQGVPLKVALRGIDRYFERYYAKGRRRRPVRIDFCEADVLDLFDEWRRSTGLVRTDDSTSHGAAETPSRRGASLPGHLERALLRLTSARATGVLDAGFDDLLDRLAAELDASRGVRGARRQALVERLASLDHELIVRARAMLDEADLAALAREADEELTAFRSRMASEAFARAREAAMDRIVRERLRLPTIAFP